LDEFAETLSTRLSNQGLSLFTDPAGAVPSSSGVPVQSGYVGYSSTITVNPSVVSNPMLVRDGTQAVAAGMGGASAFTPNPTGGPAGFTTLIDRVLQFGFGAQAQANVAQPTPATTGLGANGSITLPYTAGTTLASFAANLVGSQAQQAGDAANTLSTAQGLQATLQAKLQSETGVSVDTELSNMVMLQNAYGANAKILTAAQSMWTDLLNAVTP
jgi:flagellar hook-associated protein 1 FlgK